jgi:hypothetical protein
MSSGCRYGGGRGAIISRGNDVLSLVLAGRLSPRSGAVHRFHDIFWKGPARQEIVLTQRQGQRQGRSRERHNPDPAARPIPGPPLLRIAARFSLGGRLPGPAPCPGGTKRRLSFRETACSPIEPGSSKTKTRYGPGVGAEIVVMGQANTVKMPPRAAFIEHDLTSARVADGAGHARYRDAAGSDRGSLTR